MYMHKSAEWKHGPVSVPISEAPGDSLHSRLVCTCMSYHADLTASCTICGGRGIIETEEPAQKLVGKLQARRKT